jgi:hypothetical protein
VCARIANPRYRCDDISARSGLAVFYDNGCQRFVRCLFQYYLCILLIINKLNMIKQVHIIDCTDSTKWNYIGISDMDWFLWTIKYIDSILKTDGECIITLPKLMSKVNIGWFKVGISKEINNFIDTYRIEYIEDEKHFKITTRT